MWSNVIPFAVIIVTVAVLLSLKGVPAKIAAAVVFVGFVTTLSGAVGWGLARNAGAPELDARLVGVSVALVAAVYCIRHVIRERD